MFTWEVRVVHDELLRSVCGRNKAQMDEVIPCSKHLRLEPPSWATRERNGSAAQERVVSSSSECSPRAPKQGLHRVRSAHGTRADVGKKGLHLGTMSTGILGRSCWHGGTCVEMLKKRGQKLALFRRLQSKSGLKH